MKWKLSTVKIRGILGFSLLALIQFGCSTNPNNNNGTATTSSILTITPTTITVAPGSSTQFTASGGTPPYNYYLVTGSTTGSSIGQTTGLFTAASNVTSGNAQIAVVDATYVNVTYAYVTISGTATTGTGSTSCGSTLSVVPNQLSIPLNTNYTFSATGGTCTGYSFSMSPSTGCGTMSTSGFYVGASSPCNATVYVTDSSGAESVGIPLSITTTGTVTTGGTPSGLVEIYRFYLQKNQDHLYSLSNTEGFASNYTLEGAAFQIVSGSGTSGTTALYRCLTTQNPQRHFLSTDPGCEGQWDDNPDHHTVNIIGYIYTSFFDESNLVPLYRFISPNGDDHLITISYTEGQSAGYTLQATLGYVYSP